MSFWPRLRRRSRGRKRSTSAAETNPYATRDIDKYKVVHSESQAQRAQFASERGVSIELVRFVSRSSRGWVYLPSETPSPSSTPLLSPDGEVSIPSPPDSLHEFSLPPPALPLPTVEAVATRGDTEDTEEEGQQEAQSSSVGNGVMGVDVKGGSRRVGSLVISRELKDQAWLQICKTAAILFVKVLVFSRAIEASTAFAFTVAVAVGVWNRGRGTFRRVFSALATQLLTTLQPYLSLQQSKSTASLVRAVPKSVLQSSAPEQLSVSNSGNVSPITESSHAHRLRSSSFAFPVFTEDSGSASPRFHVQKTDSPRIVSSPESVSPVPSPLVESNKLPSTKPCHRLKAKLFKRSPGRKGENSSPVTEFAQSNDTSSSSGSSSSSSPARGKSSKRKASRVSRKPGKAAEEECYGVEQPESSLKAPKKITRSHELVCFRSPNNKRKESAEQKEMTEVPVVPPAGGVMNLSRSQELKLSLKSLGKKKVSRSQELITTSPHPPVQDLALLKRNVEGLEALAFPFKAEGQVQQEEERPSVPSSPRQSPKNRCSLSKFMAVEPTNNRSVEAGPSSPRGSLSGGSVKGVTSASSTKASAMLAVAELNPGLRKVRTTVPAGSEHQGSDSRRSKTTQRKNPPLPTQSGELGRSLVFSREILGSLLLLAVLGFLLLGRVRAILCTSLLCLLLSHLQRVFHKNLTPRDLELLKRSSGVPRLHHASSSPPNFNYSNCGSPAHEKSELQSSEYRKRVLIEGLLDRGNRRGSVS